MGKKGQKIGTDGEIKHSMAGRLRMKKGKRRGVKGRKMQKKEEGNLSADL